jgi:serine/threonine-protein kinase
VGLRADTHAPQATESGERSGPTRGPAWLARIDRRYFLLAAGSLAGSVLAGYLLAALVFFPAPIFASSHAVPRLIGLQERDAERELQAAGLRVAGDLERVTHPTADVGAVVWQDPPPGVVAPEATEVQLTVSTGPQRIPVPDVAGYEADQARMLLQGAGLKVGSTESTQAPTPKNVVVNTRPTAGTALVPGSQVTLVVSVGAATIRVPSLTGLTLDEARLALETGGLALGTSLYETTQAAAPGEIFYQEPSPGALAAPGTVVNVRVARSRS